MKTRKMLAGISALVLSASACAVSIPASAEEINYEAVYSDYVYNTLIPDIAKNDDDEKADYDGIADHDVRWTSSYDYTRLFGIVGSAIYDFGQDGTKELVVVSRKAPKYEETEPTGNDDWFVNTNFYIDLYQADENGNVQPLDKGTVVTVPHYAASGAAEWVERDALEIVISGNSIYLKDCMEYPNWGNTDIVPKYAVYDVIDNRFQNQYALAVTAYSVYDVTNCDTYNLYSLIKTLAPLYVDTAIKGDFEDEALAGKYSSLQELNTTVNENLKNSKLNFNSASVDVDTIAEGVQSLRFNIDITPSVNLLKYTSTFDEAGVPGQKLSAPMIAETDTPVSNTYTAVQLAKMKTSEVAEILSPYTVEDTGLEGGWYIYNNDLFPNVIFGIWTFDYSGEMTDGVLDMSKTSEILKNKIASDACNFDCIRSSYFKNPENFPITDKINSSFNYKQCAEILGDFDCKPTGGWTIGADAPIGYELHTDGCIIRLYFMNTYDPSSGITSRTYTAAEMNELNPKMIGFEVSVDPNAQEEPTETTNTTSETSATSTTTKTTTSSTKTTTATTKSTTAKTNSSSSSATTTSAADSGSPKTSDKLPAAAGLTALAALAAGVFTRRKNK